MGSLSLLLGIFPTQGSNPGIPHYRQILYQLSHKGNPRKLEWVAYITSLADFPTQESNWGLLHCRWILYQLSSQGSPFSLIFFMASFKILHLRCHLHFSPESNLRGRYQYYLHFLNEEKKVWER